MGNLQILSRESGRMTPVETEAGTLETTYLAVRAWGEGSNKDHSPWSQRAELKESLGESFFPLSLTHWIRWEKGLLSLYLEKAQFLIRFSHRKGYVSKKDYTSFLVDKESENIKSSNEIENAFEALAEGKAYITKEDMKQVRVQLCPFSLWSHHNLDFAHLEHGCLLQATTIPAKPSFFFLLKYGFILDIICLDHQFVLSWPSSITYRQSLVTIRVNPKLTTQFLRLFFNPIYLINQI